ncbi:hypothetical protein GCM10022295_91000 [Streptomyces osmaniensis]|uniref:Uncharacterized protein n=1 Tax=Streptomyces osmaniensis TaxID=593134 RepID=A0ABP6Z212_9ACTN
MIYTGIRAPSRLGSVAYGVILPVITAPCGGSLPQLASGGIARLRHCGGLGLAGIVAVGAVMYGPDTCWGGAFWVVILSGPPVQFQT